VQFQGRHRLRARDEFYEETYIHTHGQTLLKTILASPAWLACR